MKPTHSATIKDVAKKAKVSIATVSRVLNNLTGYSDKTRQKVMEAIKETNYQPNAIARGLINKRTQTIGVLLPKVSVQFSSDILQGIGEYAQSHDYSVIVCNTDADGSRTLKYLQVLREKQVDGIIYTSEVLKPEYYEVIQAMKIPVVLVASESPYASVPYVKVNDWQASYDAVTYLIGKGHRRIAMISGTEKDPIAGRPRVQGYLKALADHGIPFDSKYLVHGNFLFDGGYRGMEEILQKAPEVTAVFAASDETALGVLSAAAKHGVKVPQDLSLVGYDNVKLAQMSVPALTTVQQPLFAMGQVAAAKLISMIMTGVVAENQLVPHSIVERETVGTIGND
ncbi:LacI family DNA-binding transcriptional regulator [Paenibacillus filicis]|uniref:LacI family DNA-binding transcriptional regulator n=1 Tax=Paenibacillus filicis TaxID=669464 RepID=A0ABU9DN67_9BACL